jgi:TolB-like protein/tetratricopeptide (TPR) repeat protein
MHSFFAELRKRKVVQVAAIYGAVAWGVTEVLVTVVEQLFLPQWVSTLTVIGFVVGFPVAMFLAWTFDITSEGIIRTTVASRRGKASIVLSIVLLVAGTGGLFFLIRPSLQLSEAPTAQATILPNSIAVLPFENAGLDPRDSYLSEGLSDELRDQLGRVAGVRVAARSSSVAAVERRLGALEVSAQLRVANIVEGSIRRQGGRFRVSVQLIEGSSGLAVWSEIFDRRPNELLMVQQAVAEAVVRRLLPEAPAVMAEPATRNATANELMLLARNYEQQVRERQDIDADLLQEAVRLYREATEADPHSALAHSRLAGALIYLGDLQAAEAPIFRALSLAPNLSEVQNTLGEYYWARGLVKEAGAAWTLAVDLNPNNPEALPNYAAWLWKQVRVEETSEMYQRALELDRLNLERYAELGSFLALQSYSDEAREVVRQVEVLFDGVAAYRVSGELWAYLGDVDKAIAWTIRARDLELDNIAHVDKLAEYYADIGDFDTALKLDPGGIGILWKMRRYEEMIDLAEFAVIEEPHNLRLRSILAVAYNAVGRYESALHILSTTGLPDSILDGARSTEEIDGFGALMNALYGAGEGELARDLAQIGLGPGKHVTYYWWINVPAACELAILGRDDEARAFLERAGQGVTLAWDPILKDLPCFGRFKDDPVYQATIRHYDELRAMLRARLPATLADFDVKL